MVVCKQLDAQGEFITEIDDKALATDAQKLSADGVRPVAVASCTRIEKLFTRSGHKRRSKDFSLMRMGAFPLKSCPNIENSSVLQQLS